MFTYVIKRLLLMVVTLFGIMVITFILTRLTPGDPAALQVRGATGGGAAVGGYQDLVEQNRRNLGLNRPLLLNLKFEDRLYAAERALDDYLRETDFWRQQGERQLGRVTTIALAPAIQRLERLAAGDPQPETSGLRNAPPEEQIRRLLVILPRLAATPAAVPPAGSSPAEAAAWWSAWLDENRDRFAGEAVERRVREQLESPVGEGTLLAEGGFAVPHLIRYLHAQNSQTAWRAHAALQAQTGLTFAATETEFEQRREEVLRRWDSWWRREKLAYTDPGFVRDAVNILANTQFGLWVTQAATLDFGDSYASRRPVIDMMAQAVPVSVVLSGLSIILSYLIAIPIGIFSAVRRHTVADGFLTVILFVLYSLPSFWVAGLLLLTTTGPPFFNWFPARGIGSEGVTIDGSGTWSWLLDRGWHLVLPVTCLTYGSIAFISRQMRSAMLETMSQDFIRTARAKGLSGYSVIMRHALRNSLIPILTISAGILPELIAGAVIIESIFSIPGMGMLTLDAILNRDYPVVNALLFLSAFLTLLGILLADLSYAIADPRITYEKG